MKYVRGVKRVTKPSPTLYYIVCSAYCIVCALFDVGMLAWLDRQAGRRWQHNTLGFQLIQGSMRKGRTLVFRCSFVLEASSSSDV